MATAKRATRTNKPATLRKPTQAEILAPLLDAETGLGFTSTDAVWDSLIQADDMSNKATRGSIYCAIIGVLWKADSAFEKDERVGFGPKKSSLKGIVNVCGDLTEAERFELAKRSLAWPAMSQGGAFARIKDGIETKTKAGKETKTLNVKAVDASIAKREADKKAKAEADKALKKAMREAKAQPQAKSPEPAVAPEAMTVKHECFTMAEALLLKFDKAKYAKGKAFPDADKAMLKSILDGIIDNIIN